MRLGTRRTILFTLVAAVFMAGAVPPFTADFSSAQPSCPPSDFVTGGGWIKPDFIGAKANFGVAGGCKKGAFWGHLQYVDHGSGLSPTTPFRVHGTEVNGYFLAGPTTRVITGKARTNYPNTPGEVDYCVEVSDNGEGQSGTGDTFLIVIIQNNYVAFGTLVGPFGGGNIQLHKGPPPTETLTCFAQ
jgi:hypothetical protein